MKEQHGIETIHEPAAVLRLRFRKWFRTVEGFDRRIIGGKAVGPRSRVKELLKIPHEIVISVDVDSDFLGVPLGMGRIASLPPEIALGVTELDAVRIDAGKNH